MINEAAQLADLLPHIGAVDRVGVDTEADSLHSYFEKLCLLQITVAAGDFLVDPLAQLDLAPLGEVLARKEIILQGADYDLRLMRRSFGFVANRVFDTVIAARLVGMREFSLAALVKTFFAIELPKGSQKANWAIRPLPPRMADYARNDTHYLIGIAERLEAELREKKRYEWFRQSCDRAVERSGIERERETDEQWRLKGSSLMPPRAAAVLRELWHWRDGEASAADRPSFHVLRNEELLNAADQFANGGSPSFRHFSPRRAKGFRAAAERALVLPDDELPRFERRRGVRPTMEVQRLAEKLRQVRDRAAADLELDPALIAPRAAIDFIASDVSRAPDILVPWQRDLLALETA